MFKRLLHVVVLSIPALFALCVVTTVHSAVPYPYLEGETNALPDSVKSNRYEVSVRKKDGGVNDWKTVHVYRSENDIVNNTGWYCLSGTVCNNPDENAGNSLVTSMTDSNHWASFDIEDVSTYIEVRVKSIFSGCGFSDKYIEGDPSANPPISSAQARDNVIHPKLTSAWSLDHVATNTFTFRLWLATGNNWPSQFYVKLPGSCHEDNPLFIFPNKQEFPTNEDPDNPGCQVGDEIIGEDQNGNSPLGKQVNVDPGNTDGIANGYGQQSLILNSNDSNKTYCIPGGTYVRGRIALEGAENVTIRGRGILSGITFRHYDQGSWSGSSMIEGKKNGINNSYNLTVEGITMTDAPRGFIGSHKRVTVKNVKMLGWHVNTDGVSSGKDVIQGITTGTLVEDSFLKLNDDGIKMTTTQTTVKKIVVWKQTAGSIIQLSWGLFTDAMNSSLDQMVLIEADRDTAAGGDQNNSVISARNMMGGRISNYIFSNITTEDTPHSFLILQLNDELVYLDANRKNINTCQGPGFTNNYNCQLLDGDGRILGLTFNEININGPISPPLKSRIDDNEDVNGEPGGIDDYEFTNVDVKNSGYELNFYDAPDIIQDIKLKNVRVNGTKITASNVGTYIDISPGVTGMIYE